VYEDREGALWIGTDGGGLDKFDRHKEQFIHYQNDPNDPYSLSDNTIRTLFEDRQGTLWIGTYRGGLNKFDRHRERFIRYQYDPNDPHSLRNNSIWSIYEDREGVLWVGAAGSGLHEFDRDKEQFTCYPPGTGGNIILSIYQDRSGALWIGTYGEGLAKFDREKRTFTTFRERDGLPSDAFYGILEDDQGFLWLSTNNGLAKFDPQTETFRNYDVSDGLQSKEFRTGAYHKSKSGEMFFGGINGFNAFYPDSISEDNPYIPPVVLTSFTQGGEPVDVNAAADSISKFTLGWPNNFFEFEFAALSYSRPEKNQYAYMLEGFDKDWSYVGTRRFERYTNLPGGTYTLKIKGSNGDGVWNEEGIAVRITVLPAFWETWTFRVIVAVVVVAAAVGIYRQRFRSIEKRSHELEALVEERTHEIEQRRQVAEGLRDILAVLNSNRPLDDILDYIVAQAGRLMGSGATVLHHIEHERQLVAIQASFGLPDELASIEGIPFYATGADEAILNRQPYAIQDLHETETAETDGAEGDPQAERWLAATRQHYRSFLAMPLTVEGEVYRCMAFYYAEPQTFSDEKIGLAVALADQAALAIENARLRDQVEEAAVAAERSRLARDLHDSVTQSLYSSTLLAEAGQRLARAGDLEHAEGYLSRLGDITQQALKEMRLLVYQLRPLALRQEGLVGALQGRLDAVERRAGVEAHLVAEGEVELPAAMEEDLYRIAQEALNNALKHAAPGLVVVNVRVEGRGTVQRVVLEIVDNGRGFDPQAMSDEGGIGLVSMQERAEKLGGTLTIISTPGEGTKVSVSVEVNARASSHCLQELTK
jgi:signal transduction histidine kinase